MKKGTVKAGFGQVLYLELWDLSPPVDSRTEGHEAISELSGNKVRAKVKESYLSGNPNLVDCFPRAW